MGMPERMARVETRIDGSDARLKVLERKMDKMAWIVSAFAGAASLLGSALPMLLK